MKNFSLDFARLLAAVIAGILIGNTSANAFGL